MSTPDWSRYTAALFSGSPLHFYEGSLEVKRVLAFSLLLFETDMPCFGSCAGLQIATLAAGGEIGPKPRQTELGIARAVMPTDIGWNHKLMQGRPAAFDVPSIHGDEVKALPDGARLLATSRRTQVQAVEMRIAKSMFLGGQYHPEISLQEIALALRDEGEEAVQNSFARGQADLDTHLVRLWALDKQSNRTDLAWQLGLDE